MKKLILASLGLALAAHANATVRYIHWNKVAHDKRGNITALDLSTGKVLWESLKGESLNFVEETSVGILTGNDEGEAILLDKTNGHTIWRTLLRGGDREIKYFLGESEEGFLVAVGDIFRGSYEYRTLWLISKEGKILLACFNGCIKPGTPDH